MPVQNVELPDTFSPELKDLLDLLLQRDVDKRLGCMGNGYSVVLIPAIFSTVKQMPINFL